MARLGMMEGRLLPPEAGRFQAFPRDRWAEEFELAKEVPLSYIEWIYDGYGEDVNPLMHDVPRLRALIAESGIAVCSICADYFMEFPFVRCTGVERAQRRERLVEVLERAKAIGAGRVVIPFVDNAQMRTPPEVDVVVSVLEATVPAARSAGVELHLETALDPDAFAAFLQRLDDPLIKVNYDTGNSTSLGYRPEDELEAYGARIGSVHIKDRKFGAGTVPLGTGDTDFPAFFAGLRELRYRGDFTLQAARSQAGDELAWARESRAFVSQHWPLD